MMSMETATLAGGCFWCLEAVFERLAGVSRVVSGYSGGTVPDPSYEAVCSGETGHAEAVQIEFDPEVISFRDLLEVFFAIHDPTTQDRQGGDVGSQYRSAIFYQSGSQPAASHQTIAELERGGIWPAPFVTQVTRFEDFYAAEGHHQDYYQRNAQQPYCRMVIDPKLAKLRERFAAQLADDG